MGFIAIVWQLIFNGIFVSLWRKTEVYILHFEYSLPIFTS